MTTQRSNSSQRNLFNPDSAACHSALQQLWVVLDHLGFKVRKKSSRESTLRVYPKRSNQYPLVNPRFESHAAYRGKRTVGAFVVFSVFSKGDERLDQHLRAFPLTQRCEFIATGVPVSRYYHHGDFVLPLTFAGTRNDEIDFLALGEPLLKMRQHLQMPF